MVIFTVHRNSDPFRFFLRFFPVEWLLTLDKSIKKDVLWGRMFGIKVFNEDLIGFLVIGTFPFTFFVTKPRQMLTNRFKTAALDGPDKILLIVDTVISIRIV